MFLVTKNLPVLSRVGQGCILPERLFSLHLRRVGTEAWLLAVTKGTTQGGQEPGYFLLPPESSYVSTAKLFLFCFPRDEGAFCGTSGARKWRFRVKTYWRESQVKQPPLLASFGCC